jgi:hypothetical protein
MLQEIFDVVFIFKFNFTLLSKSFVGESPFLNDRRSDIFYFYFKYEDDVEFKIMHVTDTCMVSNPTTGNKFFNLYDSSSIKIGFPSST